MSKILEDRKELSDLFLEDRVKNTDFFELDREAMNRFLSHCHFV